jgi:hypothetical protein
VWWMDVIVAILLIAGVYGLLVLTGFEKRVLTRKTSRTAESMYDNSADSAGNQRSRAGQQRDS